MNGRAKCEVERRIGRVRAGWAALVVGVAALSGVALATAAVFNGDMTSIPTSGTKADVGGGQAAVAGSWYIDRFPPALFDSYSYGGGTVLRHGLRIADGAANRNSSFSSSFYNTQGRKFDVGLTGAVQAVQIDLHLPANWGTEDRSAGLWATGFDVGGAVSAFPIIAFRHSGNSSLWGGSTVSAAFYGWDYNLGGYPVSVAATTFDTTHRLSFVLTVGVGTSYFVDGVLVGSIADTSTVSLGNIIINATNFGDEDYDVYWDNLVYGGSGAFDNGTDTDRDGLSNWRETYVYHTNPSLKDTDGDTIEDGIELATGTDPLVSNGTPTDADADGIPDSVDNDTTKKDADNDGILDAYEFAVNHAASVGGQPPLGSLDGSAGRPNTGDAKALAKVVAGVTPSPGFDTADVNRDGIVNNKDTILLQAFAKGLIPYLPYP
ncbi:MAG: hypothetical protein K8T90_04875 [Planctomycetes bacterium]|nr:hypothetical protein [Planctomycetota bacterium]